MVDNKKIASSVLEAIGGKNNVVHVTHCMTRLRFNLKDESLPQDEELKAIDGVLGVVRAGGQLQVIIGQNVPKVYTEVCAIGSFAAEKALDENPDAPRQKLTPKTIGMNIMNYLSGSMTPLIPAMISAAMFKTLQVLLGPDLLHVISADSDMYRLCGYLYSAFFYFLPVFLGFTAARKLGVSQVMGLFTGAMLLVPDFVALAETQSSIKIYGLFHAPVANYSQTVLPVLLAVWVMSYVEKFFKKIIPDALSTIFVPFLTTVIMVPVTFCALAPIGSWGGQILGNIMIAFGGSGGFIAIAVAAAFWEFIVMSGMHQVLIMFSIATMAETGVDNFAMVAGGIATWAAFGMALGAALRLRNKEEKGLAFGYFISGIIGGVTEPVLYGIGFKYKKPFIALIIGGFIGGLYAGLTHVGVYVVGATNFLLLLAYVSGGWTNIINGAIASLLAMAVTAGLTYFIGFEAKGTVKEKKPAKKGQKSPLADLSL